MRMISRLPVVHVALVLLVLLISGCGLLPETVDDSATWSANKLYAAAKEAMADGNYEQAIKLYEKLEARYPYGRYAQQAQIETAYAYYKSRDAASALSACDRFIKLHPNHPNIDYMYYLKGLVNFNDDLGLLSGVAMQDVTERDQKAARESFSAFKELVTKFPDSKYTPDATQRMAYLVNALASGEVHVARYYMKRGAYLAAANRASFTIKVYPDAPANEEALYILIKAYDAMGMNDLRDDAERVMRKNFPKSVYYVRGLDRPEPWYKLW